MAVPANLPARVVRRCRGVLNTPDLRRVKELFLAASELPEDQRVPYLDAESVPNGAVRERVLRQLARFDHEPDDLPAPGVDHFADSDPETIGTYRVIERVAEGGMGIVYRAEQTEPVRRIVAVKVIKPGMDSRALLSRFEAERQTLAAMDHPGIAKVFDAGADALGRPYFVMEYVDGVPITEYCDRERLDPLARLQLFVSVCRGVQHAHQRGVLHRDLKPGNVLVTLVDGDPQPKIIDFGVAKAVDQDQDRRTLQTQMGLIIGTLGYMSPEQADPGSKDIDIRSDVYSLGVLLYELLSGELPFDAELVAEQGFAEFLRVLREIDPARPSIRASKATAAASLHAQSRRLQPRALAHCLRGDLDWITLRALRKEREQRYESAGALAQDLERFLRHEPVAAGPPTVRYRVRKYLRRNRAPVATVALIGSSLIAATGVSISYALESREQARAADDERREAAAARDRADEARKDAERVTEFLTGTLGFFDPDVSRDPNATANDFLARAAESARIELADQPAVEAAVHTAIAGAFWNRGKLGAASEQFERALELCEGDASASAEELHAILWPFGWLTYQLGEPRSTGLWSRALIAAAEVAGKGDAAFAQRLHGLLAGSRSDSLTQSLSEEAMNSLFVHAESRWPARDPRWLALGDLLIGVGESAARHRNEPDIGIRMLNTALATYSRVDRAALHVSHTRLGLAREELLRVHMRCGNYARAERVADEAIAALAPALPDGHWYPAVFHAWRGSSLMLQGHRDGEAMHELEESCGVLANTLGPQSLLCATPIRNLIEMLNSEGRSQRAGEWRNTLALGLGRMNLDLAKDSSYIVAALGPEHSELIAIIAELDELRMLADLRTRPEVARPVLERLLAECSETLAGDDVMRSAVAYWLYNWCNDHSMHWGSMDLIRSTLAWVIEAQQTVDVPGLALSLCVRGIASHVLGEYETAEAQQWIALEAIKRFGLGRRNEAIALSWIGRSQFAAGREESGLELQRSAYREILEVCGPGNRETGRAFLALSNGYRDSQSKRTTELVELACERLLQLVDSRLPYELNLAAWRIVREPGLSAAAYEIARAGIREAVEVESTKHGILNTLGAAEYRCGDDARAIEALLLSRGMASEAGQPPSPLDDGYLALSYARLGQDAQADEALADLRLHMKDPTMAVRPDCAALLAEVEQVFAGR